MQAVANDTWREGFINARNEWIRYYQRGGKGLGDTSRTRKSPKEFIPSKSHVDEIIQLVNNEVNTKKDIFTEDMIRCTVLTLGLIEGVIKDDQVYNRLYDETEDKIVRDILRYINTEETLGDKEFDTLVDKVILVTKKHTAGDPKWKKITDDTEDNSAYIPNFVLVKNDDSNGTNGKEEKTEDDSEDKEDNRSDLLKYFSSIIPKGKHFQINKNGSMLELVVAENGTYICFSIDPDILIGNGYNILANIPNDDTIFVNLKHEELVSKIVNDKAYVLTPEEIITVRADMFTNDSIYRFVDMSGMSGNIRQLTKEEFSLLGKKLTCITNIDSIAIHNAVPRMRFSQFESINDFRLVSDYSCVSPMDISSEEIHEGLIIGVKNDTISVDLSDGGGVMLYPIQYGVM